MPGNADLLDFMESLRKSGLITSKWSESETVDVYKGKGDRLEVNPTEASNDY